MLVGVGAVLAFHSIAQSNSPQPIAYGQSAYFNLQDVTLQNTSGIPNEDDWEAHEARRKADEARARASKRASNGGFGVWGCVRFAKALTGHGGTWGDGGRKLSRNSDGQAGDVAIFKAYVHVAVVIGRQADTFTIREWITVKVAPRKYSAYERTRTASLSEFSGFHKF